MKTFYGLGLRIHVAASTDKNEKIAGHVAKQQIEVMASYLNFKKKYKSGFGMNSFWIILLLDDDGNMSPENACMIELLAKLFTPLVLDSTIFMIERDEPNSAESKRILDGVVKDIAKKSMSRAEHVVAMAIKTLRVEITHATDVSLDNKEETAVASMFKIFDVVAKQTYRDPNPFEPEGLSNQDALAIIETVRQKYSLKELDWHFVVNQVYTMIPN